MSTTSITPASSVHPLSAAPPYADVAPAHRPRPGRDRHETGDPTLRQGNAFYLALHGAAHVGGAVAVRGGDVPWIGTPWLSLGSSDALAWAWLAVGAAYLLGAVLLVWGRHWRGPLTVAAFGSLALSALWLPTTWPGVAVNAVILLVLWRTRPLPLRRA